MSILTHLRNFARWLAQLEIWCLAFAVAASVAYTRLLPAVVILAAFFWLVRWAAYGRPSLRTPFDWAMLLLLLMLPVTLWATSLPAETYPQVYRLLSGMALFYAIVNWGNSPQRFRLLVAGLTLAGLALALMAPLSVEWPVGKLPFIPAGLYQRFSLLITLVHPNVMAGSLALILPIPLTTLLFGWRQISWLERFLSSATTLLLLAIVALTQSRGAWMAAAAVLVVLPLLRWRWGWSALLLAGGIAVYLVSHIGIRPLLEIAASGSSISGVDGRLEIWSRAIYMIQDFPFTGIGMGSFAGVADALYPFFQYSPGSIPHAHNLFLQVAVDLGIPGLIAWLALLITTLALAWQVYRLGRSRKDHWAAGVGAGLLCSQLAMLVHGMTDAVVWGMIRPAPLVWAIWGLAVTAWSIFVGPHSDAPHSDAPHSDAPHPEMVSLQKDSVVQV